MVDVVNIKKNNKVKSIILGIAAFGALASSASAASSTALINYTSSAEGAKVNIHDGASQMTVTNAGGGPYGIFGYAKKYVAVLPDSIVHNSYAAAGKEVKTNFYPDPSTYYAVANTEYNTTALYGAVRITD